MKTIALLVCMAMLGTSDYAAPVQTDQDPKAKKVLDALSSKTKAYKTIHAEFAYTLKNEEDDFELTQDGVAYIKGQKFWVKLEGNTIFSDGKYLYTYSKDEGETYKNNLDNGEGSFNPADIFNMSYDKEFKYKYERETKVNGVAAHEIRLFPKQQKSYHTLVLYVDKAKSEIMKVISKGKEGSDFIYAIKTFTPNKEVSDSKFTYSATKYPGDILDLTDE